MQLLIERILQIWGLEVTLANNGQEGIELALAARYNLILMDLQMPVMGGIEATELLRQVGYTTPIVALTANVTDSHRDQFIEAGGDDFLTKPIIQTELKHTLEKYLPLTSHNISKEEESILVDPQLMALFIERTTLLRQQLIGALADQQWDEVYAASHTSKGSGSTFGYPKITTLGKQICDTIHKESYSELPLLTQQLIDEMGRVSPAITS